MATTVFIDEFENLAGGLNGGPGQAALTPRVAHQLIAVTSGASTASSALNSKTRLVRVYAAGPCYVDISTAPVAKSTSGIPFAAGMAEYFGVKQGCKVAARCT